MNDVRVKCDELSCSQCFIWADVILEIMNIATVRYLTYFTLISGFVFALLSVKCRIPATRLPYVSSSITTLVDTPYQRGSDATKALCH
jgi:hypothetical protein